jgi:predicted  nucleic acid-binding Zn-ribbon protein
LAKKCTPKGAFPFSGLEVSKLREQLEILASLQEVDREIRDKNLTKDTLLAELKKDEGELHAHQAEVATLKAEWTEKDKLREEKERILQEEGRKAMEKRMRLNRIKNIKELQALQREIDQIKESNAQLEEELMKILEELEASGAQLKAKGEEVKELEGACGEKRAQVEAELAGIEQAMAEASKSRQVIAARLNGDLIERYELIFSRRGGVAVVGVSEGICQGCHMNIPPQLWNEIIRSERLIFCPSCHRILYHKPAVSGDKRV